MDLITILIVNYNTTDFIQNTLELLPKITKNNYRVHILDNGSRVDDFDKLAAISREHPEVILERNETSLRGSLAHGTAMNYLAAEVKTPYFCILDSDALWLKKNWDEILINQLNNKIKIVGTQADGLLKPKDFPAVYAAILETKAFKELNIDFRPKDISESQDTGFEMRGKYLAAGYNGQVWPGRNTRIYKNGPFAKLTGVVEYYLDNDAEILAVHFGRGSNLGTQKYKKGWRRWFYKIPRIGRHFLRRRGEKETAEWRHICQEIVAKQI
ncbi:glycosyltransferase [Candidatus Kuenenbacteria bacterium]|nr:glycosyltransferase [Candidatus Kuenenbacteria bacterium]